MAFNRVSAPFLIALLLFAAANPSAAQAPTNMSIHGLTVGGRLCCSPNGNCGSDGVGGAAVRLNCTVRGRSVGVGMDKTSDYGSFNITVPSSNDLNFDFPIVPCFVSVQLPINKCKALSNTTGVLVSGVKSIGTGHTSSLGLVRNATITGFMKHAMG